MAEKLEQNFYARCPPEKRPLYMQDFSASGSMPSAASTSDGKQELRGDENDTTKKSPYDSSLAKALHKTFMAPIWLGGIFLLLSGKHAFNLLIILKRVCRNVKNNNAIG
jgi:ATP-binding cassette, subfamily C (CFTR/MRP), member 1